MDIRRFLHMNNVDVFGLIETRVKSNNWLKVSNSICNNWAICTNHQSHKGGRIWMLWNPKAYQVDIQHVSSQTIHARLTDRVRQREFWITFVYGFNKAADRKNLWTSLKFYQQQLTGAWLIGGDFNNVLLPNERIRSQITAVEIKPFQDCVHYCGVEDIKAVGSFFTWTNKQEASQRVYSRIDRVMINDEWINMFPESFANFLPEGLYDHCPCIVQLEEDTRKRKIPFRYFNMWAKAPEFMNIVTKHWSAGIYGTPMYTVVKRLKAMKGDLKKLNRDNFHDIEKNAHIMLMSLHSIQTELRKQPQDTSLIEAERNAAEGYRQLEEARQSFLLQKSKAQWLAGGMITQLIFIL
ncbi:uncharacterized protein LOC141589836 [Silene latifolia]|uniref:uncharacterized protein LOC141589836 n=1 Tax=Silene latifolia TaxID=37657 RepID=UPI003D772AC4